MQSYSLTVDKFLDHAAKWFGDREIVEADQGQVIARANYTSLRERSNRMSGALFAMGMKAGERIATLAWNTQHHFEIYYAAMGAGLVCHTLNPRLTAEQLSAMVNEAADRILAVSSNLAHLAEQLVSACPTLEHVVVLDGALQGHHFDASVASWDYETLLSDQGSEMPWGMFDENLPAGLCYTSGTTGRPKGVLYTHRSNYLHTLRSLQSDAMAITRDDVVLVAVPMFHANGWGMPFAGPAVGSTLVLPGRHTDGKSLARLLRDEHVTIGVGVQTVWLGVVEHLKLSREKLPDLERVIIGGSNCPEALIRQMEDGLGARVQTSWGMTELSPLGTISPAHGPALGNASSGRPPIGLDFKLVDAEGQTLQQQRDQLGHLRVKGASVVDRYFKAESDALDEEGYFDTGDLATIDAHGNLTICGRSKDLIKSGGEWINPAEIESIVGRDSSVSLVAVISRPHHKWGERPLLVVQPSPGKALNTGALIDLLRGKVADWWIPEEVARVADMPLAASGKIDKRRLRLDYEAGRIPTETIER